MPSGFQQWAEFGAPAGAPGKVRQNLTLKQHELFGWLLSMHILSSMELVAQGMLEGSGLSQEIVSHTAHSLPAPLSGTTEEWSPLLYGSVVNQSRNEWTVSPTTCRTAFDPIISGGLAESVLLGTAGDDVDLLHPKGAMFYTKGWVLDLEPAERREKQLMKQWDNLGFVDYRKAYYGVPTSGALSLFLPVEGNTSRNQELTEQKATDIFKFLVVCQSNASGGEHGCNLGRDVTFTVGGARASKVKWIYSDAVAYAGKRLCVLVDIPENAKLTTDEQAVRAVVGATAQNLSVSTENRRLGSSVLKGLALEIEVTNKLVTWHKGACSVAHIIWEAS